MSLENVYVPDDTFTTTLSASASLLSNNAGPFNALSTFNSPQPKSSSTPTFPISVAVDKIVCLIRLPSIQGYFPFNNAAVAVTIGAA